MWKKLWDLVSGATSVWGLLPSSWQVAIIGIPTMITGIIGYQGSLYFALIGAAIVFGSMMLGVNNAVSLYRKTTVFQKIGVMGIGIAEAGIVSDGPQDQVATAKFTLTHLAMNMTIKNHAELPVFIKIGRTSYSMEGRINQNAKVRDQVFLVPGLGEHYITFATLPDIPIGDTALSGGVDVELHYGPAEDALKYVLHYIGEPKIGLEINPESGRAATKISTMVREHKHSRTR